MKTMETSLRNWPLHWPIGWERTKKTTQSRFYCTIKTAIGAISREIALLGGIDTIISTNIPTKNNGQPYSSFNPGKDFDTGVAVYFQYQGKPMVFASDKFNDVAHNLRAVEKTIAAIRGIERWGCSDMMQRAFMGFEALPSAPRYFQFEGATASNNLALIKDKYRELCKKYHPDNKETGDAVEFKRIQDEYQRIVQEV